MWMIAPALLAANGSGGLVALYLVRRRLARSGKSPTHAQWAAWLALECVIALCLCAALLMLV